MSIENEEVEALDVQDEAPSENSVEAKARDLGWKPQEEFKGPPEKWRSAEEFMHRADTAAPLLKGRVDRLERQLASQQQFHEQQMAMQKAVYESQMQELKGQRREAIELGDVETTEALDSRIDDIRDKMREVPEPIKQPQISPELQAFADRHSHWLDKDAEITADAVAIGASLRQRQQSEGWTEKEFIVHLERRLRDLHGDRLEPKRDRSAVEGGTRGAPRGVKAPEGTVMTNKGPKSYRDLPPEAKEACEDMIGTKMFKGMTPEQARTFYVKNYIW